MQFNFYTAHAFTESHAYLSNIFIREGEAMQCLLNMNAINGGLRGGEVLNDSRNNDIHHTSSRQAKFLRTPSHF